MPAELWEDQYELSVADAATGGFVFGTEDTGYLTLERPVHSGGDITPADQQRPYEDGTTTGRDYRGNKTTSFIIGVLTDAQNKAVIQTGTPLRTNLDFLDYFEARWMDPRLRKGPNRVAMLRTCEGGRTSRAYGRPRRYEEAVGSFTDQGYTPVVCDFALVENAWYEDEESNASASLTTPPDGGFEVPFEFPLTMTGNGEESAVDDMVVGGTIATWPVVEFHGPVVNPEVRIGSVVIGLTVSLAYDEVIIIDTRPWRRTVLRQSDSASFSGRLSGRSSSWRSMSVLPGVQQIEYSGRDATGSTRCVVRWRNARNRP